MECLEETYKEDQEKKLIGKHIFLEKKVLKLLKKWTGAVVRTLIAVFLPRISVNDGHLAEEKYAAAAPQTAPTLAIKPAKS